MLTKRDPHVNMVRATIAVVAAGLGGADAITVLPFTTALGLPDRFARRLARNTQLVLLEEANLARVTDPAAGTGFAEAVTLELSHAAWRMFQEIEAAGGAWKALEQGAVQRKIAAVRAAREHAVARRFEILTGTSGFANLDEVQVAVRDVAPLPLPPPVEADAFRFEPLCAIRLATPFETLRDTADWMLLRRGARPTIFLANLGEASDFAARARFAADCFAAGGIQALANEGFANCDRLIAAFRDSGARLACLCSSDEIYAREGLAVAGALAEAGAAVWVSGRPGALESAWRAAGVRGFVFSGCDAVVELHAAHAALAAS
jgi:methylmalonyl-CoA mutase